LRGEVAIVLKEPTEASTKGRAGRQTRAAARPGAHEADMDHASLARFQALKQWRAEVAKEHNLPAYVVFHDATLADMARVAPRSLDDLAHISGVGAKKLQAYGEAILARMSVL
jgi:ATP-dependent DNA helicase RecQ